MRIKQFIKKYLINCLYNLIEILIKIYQIALGNLRMLLQEVRQEYHLIRNNLEQTNLQVLKDLLNLKCLYSKQLPKMPRQYIVKLVFDGRHYSIIIKRDGKIIGGVTYRGFQGRKFYEIAFLAVDNQYRSKGLGSQLIKLLKKNCQMNKISYIYTHADISAIQFFEKMGFREDITLPKNQYNKCLLQYMGSKLMQCRIYQHQNYQNQKLFLQFAKNSILNIEKGQSTFPFQYDFHKASEIIKWKHKQSNSSVTSQNIGKLAKFIPGLQQHGFNQNNFPQKKDSMALMNILYCQKLLQLANSKVHLIYDKQAYSQKIEKSPQIQDQKNRSKNKRNEFILSLKSMQLKLMRNGYEYKSDFIKQFRLKINQIFADKNSRTEKQKEFLKKMDELIFDFEKNNLKVKLKEKKTLGRNKQEKIVEQK